MILKNNLKINVIAILTIFFLSWLVVEVKRNNLSTDFNNQITNFLNFRDEFHGGKFHGFDEEYGTFYNIDEISKVVDFNKEKIFKSYNVTLLFKLEHSNFDVYTIRKNGQNRFNLTRVKSEELGFRSGFKPKAVTVDKFYQYVYENLIQDKYDFNNNEYDKISNFLDYNNDYYEFGVKEVESLLDVNSIISDNYIVYVDSQEYLYSPKLQIVNYFTDLLIYSGLGILFILLVNIFIYYSRKRKSSKYA